MALVKNNSRKENTPTPHNAAKKGQIAPTVLLPGDPQRAEWIAKTFLTGAKLVTDIRGMKGFTGKIDGKPVTVMGSGMGAGSAGIYIYELYNYYGVEAVVRIGTCCSFQKGTKLGSMIFAMTASTDSNYEYQYGLRGHLSPAADFGLLEAAADYARKNKLAFESHFCTLKAKNKQCTIIYIKLPKLEIVQNIELMDVVKSKMSTEIHSLETKNKRAYMYQINDYTYAIIFERVTDFETKDTIKYVKKRLDETMMTWEYSNRPEYKMVVIDHAENIENMNVLSSYSGFLFEHEKLKKSN